jgi:hypothetical protein
MPDTSNAGSYLPTPEPFGKWLLSQRDRGDWVDALATAARADRTFPKTGDPEAARAWLQNSRASGDDWEALEDAESAWQSLKG